MNDSDPPKPKRRWYQFSLRTLLIAVLVLSLPLSWLGVRVRQARKNRKATAEVRALAVDIRSLGAKVLVMPQGRNWLEELLGDPGVEYITRVSAHDPGFGDTGLGKLRGLTSLESLQVVYLTPLRSPTSKVITDAGLEHLRGLTSLRQLDLSQSHITNAGLVHLQGLRSLQILQLYNTSGTDAGLEHLKGLTSLQGLQLGNTHVTDAGLKHLERMASLEWLYLSFTEVTDSGLEYLKGLTNLRAVFLYGTKVTDEGVKKLQEDLPNCKIEH